MKSQDIGLLLKLVSLQKHERGDFGDDTPKARPTDWEDWEIISNDETESGAWLPSNSDTYLASRYTARALEQETGISKSQVNLSLKRCIDVGLAKNDRKLDVPRANTRALFDLIVHGIKYFFPAKPGALDRGIATAFAAPVLKGKLGSAGEHILVWPDAQGNTKGQSIEPLFKSVPYAVKRDPEMYALLALIDAIRLGQPREANLASELLKKHLEV